MHVSQGNLPHQRSEPSGRCKVQLSSYNNSWYNPGPRFKIILWMIISWLFFTHTLAVFNGLKCRLLRLFGASVGVGVVIKPGVQIKYPWLLTIEDDVWIGERVWIDNLAPVFIGHNVCISQGCTIITGNHNYNKTTFDLQLAPIHIEEGVWLGAMSMVCPGIRCHTHAVLLANSVASANLQAYGVYRGNPAVVIKVRKINV